MHRWFSPVWGVTFAEKYRGQVIGQHKTKTEKTHTWVCRLTMSASISLLESLRSLISLLSCLMSSSLSKTKGEKPDTLDLQTASGRSMCQWPFEHFPFYIYIYFFYSNDWWVAGIFWIPKLQEPGHVSIPDWTFTTIAKQLVPVLIGHM